MFDALVIDWLIAKGNWILTAETIRSLVLVECMRGFG